LREYLEAMRALWTQNEGSYAGAHVSFGPSWAWPKPPQAHVPVLLGAGATPRNFAWIAAHADGWITTPAEDELSAKIELLTTTWTQAGRAGRPQVIALAGRPDAETLARWESSGVTEVAFGLPDRDTDAVTGYIAHLGETIGLSPR
jgi:alkanesulfonate monooxygenase SsuD/methylene tetrahydromethanopterin reductase-like flavin-dependent oxidoreductase (luciferase family)